MTLEEENAQLRALNQAFQEQLQAVLARIEELERKHTPPPFFVKANVAKTKEKKPRKKCKPEQNKARHREQLSGLSSTPGWYQPHHPLR